MEMEAAAVYTPPGIFTRLLQRYREWRRRNEPDNLELHALRELAAAGIGSAETGPDRWMHENVLELIRTFAAQCHSGYSAGHCIALFRALASFEPIVPLSGDDSEWSHVGSDLWQNKRCSHVFKGIDGQAYDIEGIIWRDPDGGCCTNFESRVPVTFPYTPTREYRDRPARQ